MSRTPVKNALSGALALLVVGEATLAAAASLQLEASRDNTLYANDSGLSNGAGPAIYAGNNGPGSERRGLILFDLSGIPAGASITQVSLDLYATSTGSNGAGTGIALHRLARDWGEGTSSSGSDTGGGGSGAPATPGDATWSDNFFATSTWANPGGDFAAASSATTTATLGLNSWSSAGLVADVQAWLDRDIGNFGWILRGDTSTGATAVRFGSRDNGIATYRPLLHVDYIVPIPLPPALALFGAGLFVIGGLARARR